MDIAELIEKGRYGTLIRNKALAEGKTQGLQEGKAQGLQEGKAQGLQEGKIATILQLWRLRFGQPAADVEQAIHHMTSDQLDGLTADLMQLPTAEAMRERLGL